MSEEFQKLQQLHRDGKIFISYPRAMDPFLAWLGWFSGWLSEAKKGKMVWKIIYIIYWMLTSYWFWLPLSLTITIILDNKLYLFCLIAPLIITHLFRSIGHGFLTYDILQDERLLDELWSKQLIAGIVSRKYGDRNKELWREVSSDKKDDIIRKNRIKYGPRFSIWSCNNSDWRGELSKEDER